MIEQKTVYWDNVIAVFSLYPLQVILVLLNLPIKLLILIVDTAFGLLPLTFPAVANTSKMEWYVSNWKEVTDSLFRTRKVPAGEKELADAQFKLVMKGAILGALMTLIVIDFIMLILK
jgi:hypothetical protein